jgi:hypothetical protein
MLDFNRLGNSGGPYREETCRRVRHLLCVSNDDSISLPPFHSILCKKKTHIQGERFMCPRVVFNTLFGLSVNYWMAIATRFLLGALNGLLGPIKVHNFSELLYGRQSNLMLHRFSIYVQAYAIEVCRPEHEALALSLVTHKLYTDRSPIPHIYIYIYIF